MLVAMAVTLSVTAAALSLSLSGRRLYQNDQRRTAVNQNVRGGIDLLGLDIQRAGQRLPSDFPAIEIADGGAGVPDALTLRRNLVEAVLPICATINSGTTDADLAVADTVAPVAAGCVPVADSDADGWPDNMQAWRDHRIANGGEVWAYAYNPVTRVGEFFRYDTEDNAAHTIHKSNPEPWQNTYNVVHQARIYVLEQRVFSLVGDVLQCEFDGDPTDVMNLVGSLTGFRLRAILQDGTSVDSLGPGDDWTAVGSIEVAIDGEASGSGRTLKRSLVTEFTPRNVLSFGSPS